MLYQIGVILLYIPYGLGWLVGYGNKVIMLIWAALREGYESGSKIDGFTNQS